MADNYTMRSAMGARAAQIDEGLRAHMNKVYGTMSVGMLITALAAWAIAGLAVTTDPAMAVDGGPGFFQVEGLDYFQELGSIMWRWSAYFTGSGYCL